MGTKCDTRAQKILYTGLITQIEWQDRDWDSELKEKLLSQGQGWTGSKSDLRLFDTVQRGVS